MSRGSGIRPGDILESSANDLGPGKAARPAPGDKIVLSYFDTPSTPEAHEEAVPRESLRRHNLSNETRVFFRSPENGRPAWRSGRIVQSTRNREFVVKGYRWEDFVPESELFVRWHNDLRDPVGFAAQGLLESPYNAERRRPFLQGTLAQRAATHGMSGLLSATVELHDHQLEVARRVLDDPVQRYLLADEVGLGKTIETILVLRQLLIDSPSLSAEIILPPHLIPQWSKELAGKLLPQQFPSCTIRLKRNDEPGTWELADLVIVDEAHNLARLAHARASDLRNRYSALAALTKECPKLLLLSATPVLNNERDMAAMLHLLEPDVYEVDSGDRLRELVQVRTKVGQLLLGLRPALPGAVLRRRIAEMREEFGTDSQLMPTLDAFESSLAAKSHEGRERAIRAIRVHLANVYRVHRRMLRTRRTDALRTTFRVTGRTRPRELGGVSLAELVDALELLREVLGAAVEGNVDISAAAEMLGRAVSLVPDTAAIGAVLDDVASAYPDLAEELTRVRAAFESWSLDGFLSGVGDELTFEVATSERAVVFSPTADVARRMCSFLAEFLGDDAVVEHTSDRTPEENEEALEALEEHRAQILVCDASAEEGRNLQFAEVLVHLGLPADPNRLEQRIGRLDRWSPSGASMWRAYSAISAHTGGVLGAWARVLQDGFGVFDSSIATLKYAVDDAASGVWTQLLVAGPDAALEMAETVRSLLADELERVREQDMLDAIDAIEDGRSLAGRLQSVEDQESLWARAADELIPEAGEPGNLRFHRYGSPVTSVGEYRIGDPFRKQFPPLVPTWRLLRDFTGAAGQLSTFSRNVALTRPGVTLLRLGAPLIDAVADFLWHDDRGRAWGLWRWIENWETAEKPWFRFDVHVEADTSQIEQVLMEHPGLEARAATRRVDAFLPPRVATLWLDEEGNSPDAEALLILQQPYEKPRSGLAGGDFNLSRIRISAAHQILPPERWEPVIRGCEQQATDRVLAEPAILESIEAARASAERLTEARLQAIRTRIERAQGLDTQAIATDLELEGAIAKAVVWGVSNPVVRIDSVGVVIISSLAPSDVSDDGQELF